MRCLRQSGQDSVRSTASGGRAAAIRASSYAPWLKEQSTPLSADAEEALRRERTSAVRAGSVLEEMLAGDTSEAGYRRMSDKHSETAEYVPPQRIVADVTELVETVRKVACLRLRNVSSARAEEAIRCSHCPQGMDGDRCGRRTGSCT
jgi:hypothetical protein